MGASETLTPEDIEVDWLGGYWKLPHADMMLSCSVEDLGSLTRRKSALSLRKELRQVGRSVVSCLA